MNQGGQAKTASKGQGNGQAIHAKVESYFSKDGKPPVTPALDGAQMPPGIASPLSTMGAQSLGDGSLPIESPPGITTGLGEELDKLVALSPSSQADIDDLRVQKGWAIRYGGPEDGPGSYADRRNKVIVIDRALKGNTEKHVVLTSQVLAHEVGHARYPYEPDYSTADAYVNGMLADEGAATLYNIRIQREIIEKGGNDIDVAGADSAAELACYDARYDALKRGEITSEQALHDIGQKYHQKKTSTTGKTCDETFREWCNANKERL